MNKLVQITSRYTSRSAVLTAFTCKYKRYIQYHYNGYGIVSSNQSLDLLIGTTVHRCLQHLLEHCRKHEIDEQLTMECISEAIEKGREVWEEALSQGGLALHSGEEERLDEIIAEQENLWIGLVLAFAIRRLPEILEEYIILEVEKEEVFEDFSEIVTFLGKADGLFLRKSDNKIIQLSIKTASMFPEVTERNIQHDMQGVSEQVCTNDRLRKLWVLIQTWRNSDIEGFKIFRQSTIAEEEITEEVFDFLYSSRTKPEVYAVQYEFLIKGQRKQDPYNSGIYKQQSFLCHPYKQDSIMNLMGGSIGFTPTNYKWKPSKGKLPKGWEKIDIWNDIGIQNWVEMLAMGKIQPEEGDPLQTILISPGLIIRLPEEIEEWKVSTSYSEELIARHLDEIEKVKNLLEEFETSGYDATNISNIEAIQKLEDQLQKLIWQYFPKTTTSCHNYFSRDCEYTVHCHEMAQLSQLEDSGLFQKRHPHHDLEENSFKERGFIE